MYLYIFKLDYILHIYIYIHIQTHLQPQNHSLHYHPKYYLFKPFIINFHIIANTDKLILIQHYNH